MLTEEKLTTYLMKLSLFEDTPEEIVRQIAQETQVFSLSPGETLIHKGDKSESLFIIRTGWLKIIANDNQGDEVTLNQCAPGEIVGELSFVDRKPRSSTVVAMSNVQVLEIKYDIIQDIMMTYPAFALAIIEQMVHRLRFANTYINVSMTWFQKMATGDYAFVEDQVKEEQSSIVMTTTRTYAAKAATFLSEFFKMTKEIQAREAQLKEQLQTLTIQIDEVKRQNAVSELTGTDFFQQLRKTAKRLRKSRSN